MVQPRDSTAQDTPRRGAGRRGLPGPGQRCGGIGKTVLLRAFCDRLWSSRPAATTTLFISTRTVDHHVSSVLTRLSVGSRHEAARIAEAWGIGTRDSRPPGPS